MKIKYPAEAFALAAVIFSTGMKTSFVAGILLILVAVFAEFLKNLLKPVIPDWSVKGCVLLGTASVCVGAFTLGFSALSIPLGTGKGVLAFVLGGFVARHVLTVDLEADYGELFFESGIMWGIWVVLGGIREFFGAGEVFGYEIGNTVMQSEAFQEMFFGFLTAGTALAFTNGILKKKSVTPHRLFWVLSVLLLAEPFAVGSVEEIAGFIWSVLAPAVLFLSVKRTLRFSRTGTAFRGLPVEMLSMGFIYMILSIY